MVDVYIAEVASLMGDPARANMLCALKDDGALTATELAHVAGVAPRTASEHLESLEPLAASAAPRHRPRAPRDESIRFARSCYDHLAGHLGVELYRSLVRLGYLKSTEDGCVLRKKGEAEFADLGIDLEALRTRRRRLAGQCLDWSERRPHLSGALGAELFAGLCDRGWLRRERGTRAVSVTSRGRRGFRDRFQIEL